MGIGVGCGTGVWDDVVKLVGVGADIRGLVWGVGMYVGSGVGVGIGGYLNVDAGYVIWIGVGCGLWCGCRADVVGWDGVPVWQD